MESKKEVLVEQKLIEILDMWRSRGFMPNASIKMIMFILAIKNMLDDQEFMTPEKMPMLFELQKTFYTFDAENAPMDPFMRAGYLLEKEYDLPGGIFDSLFDNRNNIPAWKDGIAHTLRAVTDLQVNECREELTFAVEDLILKCTEPKPRMGDGISSQTTAELLNILLELKDGESFGDGAIGCGISAVKCVQDVTGSIWGMDLDIDSLQIAALYFMLAGKKNFRLVHGDFTLASPEIKFDKIAMEIPAGVRATKLIGNQLKLTDKWMGSLSSSDMDILFVAQALEMLNEKGRAVFWLPNAFFFRQNKSSKIFRKRLLEEGYIKAIIATPPLNPAYVGVKGAIVVVERNTNNNILFVDLDGSKEEFFIKERRSIPKIIEEKKERLCKIVENREEVEGVSCLASFEEIAQNEYDLSAVVYMKVFEEKEYEDIESLNIKIQTSYEKLQNLIDENKKLKLFM